MNLYSKICFACVILVSSTLLIPAQSLTVVSPAAGDSWCRGKPYTIQWNSSGKMSNRVKIRLFNAAGTAKIINISNDTANNGSFSWAIPGSVLPGNYTIMVKTLDNAVHDLSDVFSIQNCVAAKITVNQPSSGTTWQTGKEYNIQWGRTGSMINQVKIRLFDAGGQNQVLKIKNSCPNSGSYQWKIPADLQNGQYRIRVKTVGNKVYGDSEPFVIQKDTARGTGNQVLPEQMGSNTHRLQEESPGTATLQGPRLSLPEIVEFKPLYKEIPWGDFTYLVFHFKNAESGLYLINRTTGKPVDLDYLVVQYPEMRGKIPVSPQEDSRYELGVKNSLGKSWKSTWVRIKDLKPRFSVATNVDGRWYSDGTLHKIRVQRNQKVEFAYEGVYLKRIVVADEWSGWKNQLWEYDDSPGGKCPPSNWSRKIHRPMKLVFSAQGRKGPLPKVVFEISLKNSSGLPLPYIESFRAGGGSWSWDAEKMFVDWEAYGYKKIRIYYNNKIIHEAAGKFKYQGKIEKETPGQKPGPYNFQFWGYHFDGTIEKRTAGRR